MVVLLVGLLILILGVIVMCLCGLGMEVMVEVSCSGVCEMLMCFERGILVMCMFGGSLLLRISLCSVSVV